MHFLHLSKILLIIVPIALGSFTTACRATPVTSESSSDQDPSSQINLPVVEQDFEPTPTPCLPGIFFDHIPAYGSLEDLQGHVACVNPLEYQVAVYTNVSGWWTKPTFAQPLTPIQSDGTWTTDITTGDSDEYATNIAAFLVPNGYSPPAMSGGVVLPQELYMNAVANTFAARLETRTIQFAGRTWTVKYSPILVGPGPNYFSDEESDVWVDEQGFLHMRIVKRNSQWYSTEVICQDIAQHGTYTLSLGSRVDLLDKNVVLGFFTWDTGSPQYHYREVDIEFSRWGEDTSLNAQFVIQPWDVSGNRYRFALVLPGPESTHAFTWQPDQVQFESRDENGALLQSWIYTETTNIPPAGAGNARINLWLLNGWAPSDGQEVEVVIRSFDFSP